MTERQALNLALQALEVANSCVDGYYIPKGKTHLPEIELAITAIKEALANVATNDTLQERVDKTDESVHKGKCPPCHGNCRQGRDCPARGLA